MTFWMPKPGMMAAGGGGAAATPEFISASATAATSANSGSQFPNVVAPVAGNLSMALFYSDRPNLQWYDSFREAVIGGAGYHEVDYCEDGATVPSTIYNSTTYDQMYFRQLTGAESGDLSWVPGGVTNCDITVMQNLQFAGCRKSMPYIDGVIRWTDTTDTRAIHQRWRYNNLTQISLTAPGIKVSGENRLGITNISFTGGGFSHTITPPDPGWTLIAERSTTLSYDVKIQIWAKELNADEPPAVWTRSATIASWGIQQFALLPDTDNYHPVIQMRQRNLTDDLPWPARRGSPTHSTTWNTVPYMQLPSVNNRKVYWEQKRIYSGAASGSAAGLMFDTSNTGAPVATRTLGGAAIPNSLGMFGSGIGQANGASYDFAAAELTDFGDVRMMAWDRDTGEVWCGKNGVWSRDPLTLSGNFSGLASAALYAAKSGVHYNVNMEDRFHESEFDHAPPAGYRGYGEDI